ncbi:hypothetical protein NC653_040415 [Populus alba x Populus x berolinensis]|uniref:Disease resistance protein winged helix domain-containing protein n=1 Tax=Populus alba x Populus x berolinensis TaxID=444605 RepID=A0AAD6PRV8_9ROSI|nr:hypothetical protein NC653_040415 [Populus alba x Populus x berolinensis]
MAKSPDFNVRTRAEIERLGREMVGRCTGLPLAIIVLGGLLATKKTIFEWDVVRQNIISHLRRGKGDEQRLGVTEVLALSYHELPYQVKPCFLHLAHFPEDCEIQTKKMIRMWVAEGFVSSVYNGVEEETMEDVAQRYLGELVERCMVQVVERGINGRIRTCRMHDLMRDLCVSKAKQENFLEVFNQSLASDHSADSFPRSYGEGSEGNLRYLQTLDLLTWNSTVQIPNVVWRLNRLRHLYLPESCGEDSYKWQLANLVNLQTLVNFPAEKCEITDLVRLNHLKKLVIDDPKFGAIFRSPHLHIEGQIEKLPECQQFSANLAKLNLLGSKLTEDPMPNTGEAAELENSFAYKWIRFLGTKWFAWTKTVPEGLRFITSLREMEIRSMLKAFRTRLEHGGEDYYKVQHVPSIAFRYCDY